MNTMFSKLTVLVLTCCLVYAGAVEAGSITIGGGGAVVDDNEGIYREHNWRTDEFTAGIEDLDLQSGDLTLRDGVIMVDAGEYAGDLLIDMKDNKTLSIKINHFRKYFSDTGGYLVNKTPSSYSLNEDLELDIGYLNIAFEIDDPDTPWRVVIAYDLAYKNGEKSLLEWNGVGGKYIYPSKKDIDEADHEISVTVEYETEDVTVVDRLSYSHSDVDTSRSDLVPASIAGNYESDQGHPVYDDGGYVDAVANALTYEKWLSEKTMVSAGYLASAQEGRADFKMAYTPLNAPGLPVAYSTHAKFYEVISSDLEQISHVLSAGALLLPAEDLTVTLGVQAELSENDNELHNNLAHGNPPSDHLVNLSSEIDSLIFREVVEARYNGFDGMVLYAKADTTQDNYDLLEQETDHSGSVEMQRDSDMENNTSKFRTGFTAYPSSRLSVNSYYQFKKVDGNYDHTRDKDRDGIELDGYAGGNITRLDRDINDAVAKLTYRVCPAVKSSLKYQYTTAEGRQQTRSSAALGQRADNYDYQADTISLSASIIPCSKAYFTCVGVYRDTKSEIPALSTVKTLAKHQADYVAAIVNGYFMLSEATQLNIQYKYLEADNGQNIAQPYAVSYDSHSLMASVNKKLNEDMSCRFGYTGEVFQNDHYNEGEADFTAHGIFASVTKRF